jgi:hypothetical protein
MPAYAGPVPPTPTGSSTDAQWQNWWAFKGCERDLRYEDERIARAVITDRQHVEKMAAEAACALATTKAAEAQAKAADAMVLIHTTPPAEAPAASWTDEQLARQLLFSMAGDVPVGTEAMQRAQAYIASLRFNFPVPAPAPTAPMPPVPPKT